MMALMTAHIFLEEKHSKVCQPQTQLLTIQSLG